MKKKQSIIALVLAAIVTVLLGWTMIKGWGPTGTGSMKNINLGLDLSGGVSITYQAVKDNPTDEEMSDTRYKLEQRAQQYSEEAQVYLQGDNRITIEIPGATDATTILEEMGKPGSLYFIKQTNDDGTENYTYDSTTGEYVLNGKTIEELEEDGSVVLTGKDVESAEAMHQQNSTTKATESVVQLKMTDEGKQKFADATQEAYSAGKSIGIYYDEKFVSVPSVNAVISDGTAVISGGNMDWDEATSLASTLRIGSLSLKLEEINSSVVGAQLGSAAVSTSVKAGAIGIVLIILFLAIVYRLPGIAAGWALLIYVELNLIALNAFDLTLTLPGIAGVILSIGMAVDANVIIYARIEEEIGAGKTVHAAIRDGFKKAASAILDGNVTTLIAAAVLYALASGSVRGFAMTLALGIVLSMFSAMIALNAAVAEQLARFKQDVDALIEKGEPKISAIIEIIRRYIKECKPVRFDGNGYSDEWKAEAARRGLDCETSCPLIFDNYLKPASIAMFESTGVMTRKELEARNEVKWETYTKKIQIEARVLGDLAMNHIIPVATEYQSKLIDNVYKMKELFPAEKASQLSAENMKLIEEIARRTIFITEHVNAMVEARKVANKIESEREKAIAYHDTIAPMLEEIRYHIDKLELIVDNQMWTLPKYRELLFIR